MNKKIPQTIRIGTRSSPLALRQAAMLEDSLKAVHPDLVVKIVPMKSAADWQKQDGERALSEQEGGKGRFATEIEKAILAGEIDCGVHSLKDMASILPEGLVLNHVLPRADARDALISENYKTIEDLPKGAVVGTCSPRRQAMALSKRPDLKLVPLRGNVQTRLDKVKNGQVEASFLAMAGLMRLGIEDEMIHPVPVEEMLPACGQGIICIETKFDDACLQEIMAAIHCVETGYCAVAERAVLKVLDGSCHTPIAAYAVMMAGNIYLKAQLLSLDGQESFEESVELPCASMARAEQIGRDLGQHLKSLLPKGFLA